MSTNDSSHPLGSLDGQVALVTGASRGRKGRSQLAGKVMHPEIGAIETQRLGGHGQLDRLPQRVRGGLRLRAGGRRPVTKGEKADLLHLMSGT